jgi:hypothetical protein
MPTIETTTTPEKSKAAIGLIDIEIDVTRGGSALLSARTDDGRAFLARIHGNFWNGRAALMSAARAADMTYLAMAMGLTIDETGGNDAA